MKIVIHEDTNTEETEITIRCRAVDDTILRILAGLRALDQKVTGLYNDQTFLLNPQDILYIDTVDRKTFLYTAERVYETPLRLYELEERLACDDFIRASKSSLMNFGRVISLRGELGGRMRCILEGGEAVIVSRQYVPAIKQKLGI